MKIAMFVEGQTENIFVQKLLEKYFSPGKIQIVSIKQLGKHRRIRFQDTVQYLEHLCLIVDVGGDESVLSKLKENYDTMCQQGFQHFFGLRDLKSEAYERFGERIIQKIMDTVKEFDLRQTVYFHFAKMEIEAWFLAVPQLFIALHPSLTVEKLAQATGKNWEQIDPETDIQNPANEIKRILSQVGQTYSKSKDDAYRIVSRIDWEELCFNARQKVKISYFFRFLDDLEKVLG
jgi:hypothetical protein